MIILGLILLLLAYLVPPVPPVVGTVGWILIVVGAILLLVHGVAGYGAYYY